MTQNNSKAIGLLFFSLPYSFSPLKSSPACGKSAKQQLGVHFKDKWHLQFTNTEVEVSFINAKKGTDSKRAVA